MPLFGKQTERDETGEGSLAGILDHLPAGLVLLTADGRLSYANATAASLLGLDLKEGAQFGDALRPYPALLSLIEMAASSRQSLRQIEIRLMTSHRGEVHLLLDATLKKNRDGRTLSLVFFDITAIREREERLRAMDRLAAVGEAAATLAHQIKTPLANIVMSLQRVAEKLQEDSSASALTRAALREAECLDSLAKSLLDTGAPARLTLVPLDPADLVREIARSVEDQQSAEALVIRTEIESGLPRIKGDLDSLRSAITNLISNAAESGASEITIEARRRRGAQEQAPAERLTVSRTGTVFYRFDSQDVRFPDERSCCVEIVVSDNGQGVAPDDVKRLFTPFFTTKAHGHGIGLVAVHRIIDAHRGGIIFRSKKGRGSDVIISLPHEP